MEPNIGHYYIPSKNVDEFKVNRWMLRHGFTWVLEDGTNIKGSWQFDGRSFSQLDAIVWYKAHKRWWKFWM